MAGSQRSKGSGATAASHAELLPAVPFTMMMKSGELRLAGDRLRFATDDEVLLDAPLDELHSLAPAVIGIHIWHADKRFRFALGYRDRRTGGTDDVAALTSMWLDILLPLIGVPPAGVTVRKPWPRWAWVLGVIALSAFFIAAILIIFRLKN
jgi:hypothetical protein